MTIYKRLQNLLTRGKDWWNSPPLPPGIRGVGGEYVSYDKPPPNKDYIYMVDDYGKPHWIKNGASLEGYKFPASRYNGPLPDTAKEELHNFNLHDLSAAKKEDLYKISRGGGNVQIPKDLGPRESLVRAAYRARTAFPEERERLFPNQAPQTRPLEMSSVDNIPNPRGPMGGNLFNLNSGPSSPRDQPAQQMGILDLIRSMFSGNGQSNAPRSRWHTGSSSTDVEMDDRSGSLNSLRNTIDPTQTTLTQLDQVRKNQNSKYKEARLGPGQTYVNPNDPSKTSGTNPLAPPSQMPNNRMSLRPGQPNVNTLSSIAKNQAQPQGVGAGTVKPQASTASGNMGMMMGAAPAVLGALMAIQQQRQQDQYYADQRQDINQQLKAADNNKYFSV